MAEPEKARDDAVGLPRSIRHLWSGLVYWESSGSVCPHISLSSVSCEAPLVVKLVQLGLMPCHSPPGSFQVKESAWPHGLIWESASVDSVNLAEDLDEAKPHDLSLCLQFQVRLQAPVDAFPPFARAATAADADLGFDEKQFESLAKGVDVVI